MSTCPSAARPPSINLKPTDPRTGIRNRLLAALPPEDQERIALTLEVIPLTLKETLHKPGERLKYVYFPGGGFCSAVAVLEDGG